MGDPPLAQEAERFGASVMFQCPLVARTTRGHGGQRAPSGMRCTEWGTGGH